MTIEEKRIRKERKRVAEINAKILNLSAVKSFHRLFTYEGDIDGAIRDAEVKEADRKISELQKQL